MSFVKPLIMNLFQSFSHFLVKNVNARKALHNGILWYKATFSIFGNGFSSNDVNKVQVKQTSHWNIFLNGRKCLSMHKTSARERWRHARARYCANKGGKFLTLTMFCPQSELCNIKNQRQIIIDDGFVENKTSRGIIVKNKTRCKN